MKHLVRLARAALYHPDVTLLLVAFLAGLLTLWVMRSCGCDVEAVR